jgi:hypothetical protein
VVVVVVAGVVEVVVVVVAGVVVGVVVGVDVAGSALPQDVNSMAETNKRLNSNHPTFLIIFPPPSFLLSWDGINTSHVLASQIHYFARAI